MKKIFTLTVFIVLFQFFAFSQEKLLNWEFALSTGIPIHSSQTEETKSDLLLSNSFNRIIAGGSADLVINFTEPVKAVFGVDTFCEFIWEKPNHYNSLDYSMYAGIKLFPNLAGFNVSVAYVLGSKANFFQTEDINNTSENTAWGNGFRIAAEYIFFYGEKVPVYPIIGGYYRYMPRGNYDYDHILAAYVGLRL